MADTIIEKTPVITKVLIGLLLASISFLLGTALPDRIGMEGRDSAMVAEIEQLKRDARQYVRREEFSEFGRRVDQNFASLEKWMEKIDRKLDR